MALFLAEQRKPPIMLAFGHRNLINFTLLANRLGSSELGHMPLLGESGSSSESFGKAAATSRPVSVTHCTS